MPKNSMHRLQTIERLVDGGIPCVGYIITVCTDKYALCCLLSVYAVFVHGTMWLLVELLWPCVHNCTVSVHFNHAMLCVAHCCHGSQGVMPTVCYQISIWSLPLDVMKAENMLGSHNL